MEKIEIKKNVLDRYHSQLLEEYRILLYFLIGTIFGSITSVTFLNLDPTQRAVVLSSIPVVLFMIFLSRNRLENIRKEIEKLVSG